MYYAKVLFALIKIYYNSNRNHFIFSEYLVSIKCITNIYNVCRCYNLADISWFRREIASFIFGIDIPTSTFEEALEYFKDAESIQPKFYWLVVFKVLILQFVIF